MRPPGAGTPPARTTSAVYLPDYLPAPAAEEGRGDAAAAHRLRGQGLRPALDRGAGEGAAGPAREPRADRRSLHGHDRRAQGARGGGGAEIAVVSPTTGRPRSCVLPTAGTELWFEREAVLQEAAWAASSPRPRARTSPCEGQARTPGDNGDGLVKDIESRRRARALGTLPARRCRAASAATPAGRPARPATARSASPSRTTPRGSASARS